MIKCSEKKCIYNSNGECKNKEHKKCYEEKAYVVLSKCEKFKES